MSVVTSTTATGVIDDVVGLSTDGILTNPIGMAIVALNVANVGDDGGWKVTASGSFPTSVGIRVWVVVPHHASPGYLHVKTFSGKQGQGDVCRSTDATTLSFVVPPLPISPPRSDTPSPFNPFKLYAATTDGLYATTSAALLMVVHRTYTAGLYKIRASVPPPYDVGFYDIKSEDYGG